MGRGNISFGISLHASGDRALGTKEWYGGYYFNRLSLEKISEPLEERLLLAPNWLSHAYSARAKLRI